MGTNKDDVCARCGKARGLHLPHFVQGYSYCPGGFVAFVKDDRDFGPPRVPAWADPTPVVVVANDTDTGDESDADDETDTDLDTRYTVRVLYVSDETGKPLSPGFDTLAELAEWATTLVALAGGDDK